MKRCNIYISGVGGQGIGLLSEILLRAADHAGYPVKAVDTHGLAQRGGSVVSQLRIGERVFSPLIAERSADLIVSLERCEALRSLSRMARDGGTLVYYDTLWQPLDVRLGRAEPPDGQAIAAYCRERRIHRIRVHLPELGDSRMQNIAVLACMARRGVIAGIEAAHYRRAMEDLMAGRMLERNLTFFERQKVSEGA